MRFFSALNPELFATLLTKTIPDIHNALHRMFINSLRDLHILLMNYRNHLHRYPFICVIICAYIISLAKLAKLNGWLPMSQT